MTVEEKPPNKFKQRSTVSHQELVSSAMHAFYERGYEGTRVEDIVIPAGHTSGSYYFHFHGKKLECFWAVSAYRERLRFGWHEAALAEPSEDLAVVVRAVLRRLAEASEGTNGWTRVMAGYYDHHRDDEGAIARLRSAYEDWMNELTAFVAELQRRGLVDRHRDARRLAIAIYAFAEGLAVHTLIFGIDPATRDEEVVNGIVRLLRDEASDTAQKGASDTAQRER